MTDCSTFAEPICNNTARYNGLLHYRRINLQQFGAFRHAETHCFTMAGSICNNSAQFRRATFSGSICKNSAQFGAPRYRGLLLQQQFWQYVIRHNSARTFAGTICNMLFGTIRRAATDCCTFSGSICKNSAQFGALRRAGSICNNSGQFGTLRHIASLWRDQSATIRRNSAR